MSTREISSSTFLLAAVAHRYGDPEGAERLASSAAGLTPSETARLEGNAAYHELEPLLHTIDAHCSYIGCPLRLPRELTDRWAQAHAREMARTAIIHFGATKALDVLAEAGIRAIPLKGFYLTSVMYWRKDARGFKDLDLLIEPEALPSLHQALLGAGFQPAPERPSFVPAPACTVYSLPMEGSEAAMEIDIHIGMHWPEEYELRTGFRSADLWSHAAPEEAEGLRFWAMCPEHLLITTFLDVAVNHRYARLVKFRDVLEILRAAGVDWDEVDKLCRRWGVRSFVGPGLRLLREIDADSPVPPEVVRSLLPSYAAMRAFARALPARALPDHRSRSFSLPNLLFFVLADTPRERARGLAHIPRHMLRGRHRF
ncbi:MAG: nucleotidyltransferase family protein [Actinobacteria bacterium]|nr:nucleotidyltransferase family protein [Actinomycetota bacterium]